MARSTGARSVGLVSATPAVMVRILKGRGGFVWLSPVFGAVGKPRTASAAAATLPRKSRREPRESVTVGSVGVAHGKPARPEELPRLRNGGALEVEDRRGEHAVRAGLQCLG